MSQSPLSTNPLPGTRDFFPEEMSVRGQVFQTLYRVVESFGYARYDGPMLEPLELYAAKSSEEIVSQQTYRMTDRGGRELVVRPEMTPTVARMIAARAGSLSLPARWYSHPNLWRYERKQRGRYREHWQINVDVFGTESWEAEAEIFELGAEMMFALGAKTADFIVRASDRNLVREVLIQKAGVPAEALPSVFGVLDQLDKLPRDEIEHRLSEIPLTSQQVLNVLSLMTCTGDEFLDAAPAALRELSSVARVKREGLTTSQPVNLRFDQRIIRGFTYYTSTVFEIYDIDPANPRSIAGGGRYDNLVGMFGKTRIPGLGFGMGDVTLIDFLETHGIAPTSRVAPDAAVMSPQMEAPADRARIKEIAAGLRAAGVRVTTSLETRKLGKLLEKAAKEGVRFAVIAAGDEAARGNVRLKDLVKSEEREVSRADLAGAIKSALAAR